MTQVTRITASVAKVKIARYGTAPLLALARDQGDRRQRPAVIGLAQVRRAAIAEEAIRLRIGVQAHVMAAA